MVESMGPRFFDLVVATGKPKKPILVAIFLIESVIVIPATFAQGAAVGPVLLGREPASQMVVAPASATFTAKAIGTAPISYQWNRNGVPSSGATSATYSPPSTSLADNGSVYTVTVANEVNGFTSDPATLTVTENAISPSVMVGPQY